MPRRLGIAGRLAIAQALVAVIIAVVVSIVAWSNAADRLRENAEARVLGVAGVLAADPEVIAAVQDDDPTATLQPYSLTAMGRTHVAFITIMSPAGIRFTHPDPSEIGKRFLGDTAPALAGRTFTEVYTGTLGPSVRAVTPVLANGRVVGLVAVGVLTASVRGELLGELPAVIGVPAAVLILGLLVTFLLARYVRGVTGNRRPEDLARMLDSDDAILHGLDEGLVLIDERGRLLHANDRALELLGPQTGSDEDPRAALSGEPGDAVLLVDGRVLVISRTESSGGRTVVILRDATELRRLAGEVESMRTVSNALRSQAHEHANRLHTIVSLIELGRPEAAVDLAVESTAAGQRLADALTDQVQDPVLVALLLGKTAEAEERGIALSVVGAALPDVLGEDAALRIDLVTIIGNLLDNAFDATEEGEPPRAVGLELAGTEEGMLRIRVTDTGPGIPVDRMDHVFARGYSTKPHDGLGRGIGLALVRAAASRRHGAVQVAEAAPHGAVFTVELPRITTTAAVTA